MAGLALGGGGYDLFSRHVAGILAWIAVGLLLIGPWPDRIRPGRSFALVGGLILALSLWALVSSIWSDSVSSSVAEFERGIGYLGFFTASYLTMRTPKQREWFARGLGAGLAAVALLALGDRLLPGAQEVVEGRLNRLTFPLGYWNANGIVFASALVLFTWFAGTARHSSWRLLSILVAVLACTGAYLTYSRGAILVTVVAMVLLLFLTDRRLRVFTTLFMAIAAATPTLITINQFPSISGDQQIDPSIGGSLTVIAVLAASSVLAWLILEGLIRQARSGSVPIKRALEISKDRRLLLGIAGTAAATMLVLTLFFGNTIWDQFTDRDIPTPVDGKSRLTEFSGSWRYEFNKVSLDTFSENPLLGSGAGTYPIQWAADRDVLVVSQDAHSFYLQNLAELGVLGGLIAIAFPASLIWLGVIAWRRRLGRDAPAMLALTVALFTALAFDWFWNLGSTAALIMLMAGWIASAEAVDPTRPRRRRGPTVEPSRQVIGLLSAWLAIVILAVPAIADRLNQASADAVLSGQIDTAADRSRLAQKLEPWSPIPPAQLGRIAESRGQHELAFAEFDRALELDPMDWQIRTLRFKLNYRLGNIEAARQDLDRLKELNPLYFEDLKFTEIANMGS